MDAAKQAIQGWARALSQRGQGLEHVLAPSGVVHRHGWGPRIDTVIEEIEGLDAVRTWVSATNPRAVFHVERFQAEADGRTFRARYRLEILNFLNRGWWRFRLDDAGRIAEVWHRADDLLDPALKQAPKQPG